MSSPREPEPTVNAPHRSPWRRRALLGVAGLAWLAIAGVALQLRQQGIDEENGVQGRAAAAAPTPPPRLDRGSECMTSAQYNHLQTLPPYGFVKPRSALAESIKARARTGGH